MTPFDEEHLRALLGERLVFLPRCASTNTEAMARGRQGAPHGTVVVTDEQTGGRGRQGRSWHAQPGQNLSFSLILRPHIAPADAAMLCFAAGAALAEILDLRLRWPNDLLDEQDRKVAGMLAELELRGPGVDFVVLGVGINVNQMEFPAEIPNPGSLAMTRGPRDRAVLLAALVPAVLSRVADVPGGNAEILDAWRARSATLGRVVQVGELRGEAVDLSPEGALLLRTAEGLQTVLAGDVQLVG